MARSSPRQLTFEYGLRSFKGYLEGTGKSALTISSYQGDLGTFREYLKSLSSQPDVALRKMKLTELEAYSEYLKSQGFRSNTRRRKLLTVQRFVRYLVRRKKLGSELDQRIPTPYKLEKVPEVVSTDELLSRVRALPTRSLHSERSRILLWVLLETGCRVSEIGKLKFEDVSQKGISFLPRSERSELRLTPISTQLYRAIQELKSKLKKPKWIFESFNKFGAMGTPISSRGVELLLRSLASRLGHPELTPRMIRHSVIVNWMNSGISSEEIQKRLGLKSDYSFRVYSPLVK